MNNSIDTHVDLSARMWFLLSEIDSLRAQMNGKLSDSSARLLLRRVLLLGESDHDALTQGERFPVVFQNAMTARLNRNEDTLPGCLYICRPRGQKLLNASRCVVSALPYLAEGDAEVVNGLMREVTSWMRECLSHWHDEQESHYHEEMRREIRRVSGFLLTGR